MYFGASENIHTHNFLLVDLMEIVPSCENFMFLEHVLFKAQNLRLKNICGLTVIPIDRALARILKFPVIFQRVSIQNGLKLNKLRVRVV